MSYGCDFMFSVHFVWFAPTSATQQTRNKFYAKNTKRTKSLDKQHKQNDKYAMLNKRSHFTEKMVTLQTKIQTHNSNIRGNNKTDKVIKAMRDYIVEHLY